MGRIFKKLDWLIEMVSKLDLVSEEKGMKHITFLLYLSACLCLSVFFLSPSLFLFPFI